MPAPPLGARYRHGLRKAVGTGAGPYGYTLTVWTTGAVLIHARGAPTTLEALLFMLGAVVGFAAVDAVAFRNNPGIRGRATSHPVLWGSFLFVPVAASLGAHFVQGSAAWPLAGLTATAIYLTFVTAQITFFEEQVFEQLEREVAELEREIVEEL